MTAGTFQGWDDMICWKNTCQSKSGKYAPAELVAELAAAEEKERQAKAAAAERLEAHKAWAAAHPLDPRVVNRGEVAQPKPRAQDLAAQAQAQAESLWNDA